MPVSTQEAPQSVVPPGHLLTHLPTLHTWPLAQGLSQPPQLAGFLSVSMQAEPQSAKPCWQLEPHWPAMHVATPLAGASQAWPHLPQFCGSVSSREQAAPHKSKPA